MDRFVRNAGCTNVCEMNIESMKILICEVYTFLKINAIEQIIKFLLITR